MYLYQKTDRYFAQVANDLKEPAEKELLSLGARDISPTYRGVYFTANRKTLYAVNFHSRLINRILAPLLSFDCHSDRVLYKKAGQIHWQDFLDSNQTFAIFATVTHSAIKHSKFAALRLKDAIVDSFRNRTGRRPSIDTKEPDVWFNLYIANNKATISLDTSGGSLHKRGYRKSSIEAPMLETTAAAIINYSGWDGTTPLHDPFCGSGTLLCEAYLSASRTPAAILRERFGFEKLPDFDSTLRRQVKKEGIQKIQTVARELINGSDHSSAAVRSSIQNCSMIDKQNVIAVTQQDVFTIESLAGKTIICNPPYGIRMGKETDLHSFYKKLGDFLKQQCRGSNAFIYFGQRKYIKNIGLKPTWKKPLATGGLDGRLVKYELY